MIFPGGDPAYNVPRFVRGHDSKKLFRVLQKVIGTGSFGEIKECYEIED